MACAVGGAGERAAIAMAQLGDDLPARVAHAATAGHVLDYDDTISDGVAHVSATCAPAALLVAEFVGADIASALDAYAAGFEAIAALAAASHPDLYDAGFHPTAVCGPVGAAVAAARLLGLDERERERAVGLALLRAGGTRGAFGSDAKAIQVGLAAAAGVQGALLARAGATVDARASAGPLGFAGVLPARWPAPDREPGASPGIERNWIKLHPSCLGTHAPIDAAARASRAARAGAGAPVSVRVDPVARQAAHIDNPATGLEAKFSIAYCVAHTLHAGPPGVRDFEHVDPELAQAAAGVVVTVDRDLPRFGAVVTVGEHEVRVAGPRGSPEQPVTPAELEAKISDLAGDRLHGALDDRTLPASELVARLGLLTAGSA